MDLWLAGYERQQINAGLDLVTKARPKVVIHTTETGPAPGLVESWRNNPGSGLPHYLGVRPDRIIQMLPHNVGAYTLENPEGGIDTNRGGNPCIQIEVCAYAIKPGAPIDPRNPSLGTREDWSAPGMPWCEALGKWLADLVRAGIDLDLDTEMEFGDRWAGMDPAAWYGFNGVCGHQDAPEQPGRHWDPGLFNIAAVLASARRQLGLGGANPIPIKPKTSEEDEDMARPSYAVKGSGETWWQAPDGVLRYVDVNAVDALRTPSEGHPNMLPPLTVTPAQMRGIIRSHNGEVAADSWKPLAGAVN